MADCPATGGTSWADNRNAKWLRAHAFSRGSMRATRGIS
jgi:hypothetical protein